MPHTKDGFEVIKDNVYNLPVRVTDVQPGAEYCNVTCVTVESMPPTNQQNTITLNTKQLVGQQVTHSSGSAKPQLVAGFGIPDILDYGKHAINVLKKAGDAALGVLEAGFKMYTAFTDRDLSKVLAAFKEAGDRVQAVTKAIKEELQLHDDETPE